MKLMYVCMSISMMYVYYYDAYYIKDKHIIIIIFNKTDELSKCLSITLVL